MKHSDEVRRNFNKTDEKMLLQSEVLLDSFRDNKSLFIERFPQFNDPFDNEWAAATAAARQIPPDYALVAAQTMESALLETLMDQGRNLFLTVMLYVQLAFPNDRNILNAFGHNQYSSARSSHLKLPVLLRSTFIPASNPEYKPALMMKGLTEMQISSLETLGKSIINQTVAHGNAKKERSRMASVRINNMNAVWGKMSLVSLCAKSLFQNDLAKYNLFILSEREGPKEDTTTPPVAE
jgi:hypothetical protein